MLSVLSSSEAKAVTPVVAATTVATSSRMSTHTTSNGEVVDEHDLRCI
jgi:hypothetical protein